MNSSSVTGKMKGQSSPGFRIGARRDGEGDVAPHLALAREGHGFDLLILHANEEMDIQLAAAQLTVRRCTLTGLCRSPPLMPWHRPAAPRHDARTLPSAPARAR